MDFIYWIVLGGIAGWIASILMKKNAKMGLIANIVVGIVGSVIGGFLFRLLGSKGVTGFNIYSLLVATVGSCLLLWIINKIK